MTNMKVRPEVVQQKKSLGTEIRDNWTFSKKGFLLAWRASPKLGAIITVLTALSAILPPVLALIGKHIIDSVVAKNAERTILFVILEFILIAGIAVVQRSLFLSRTLLGNRLGIEVNSLILEKTSRVSLSQIENSEFYDKMNRARMEASSRSLNLVTDAFQLVQNALTLLAYMTLLLSFSSWAVLAMLVASLPATIAEMKFSQIGFRLYNWRSPERRKMAYMEYVLSNDAHAKEVRIFGLGKKFYDRYRELAEKFYLEDSALSGKRTLWTILLSLLSSGAFYGCYLVIALEAAAGLITLGSLTLYVMVFRQGQQAFQSCLAAIGGMYEHNLYLSNLFEFMDVPVQEVQASTSLVVTDSKPGILFKDVSFKYPSREGWAVRNINLHIPPGQSVAVVGQNGAGKSTLIKLLCRLYEPTTGKIFLDGKDLHVWDHAKLLERISIVFQDYNRYQLSIRENVGIGKWDYIEKEDKILNALQQGGAGSLLADMPKGIDTALGNWFSGGRELSGGQWQKIAVSRAFIRENADILILDEPTAALDAEAESQAYEHFQALTKGKTSLIISHRFPLARLADHIIVLENGEIMEEGSHAELIAANQRYANLFQTQAKGYY